MRHLLVLIALMTIACNRQRAEVVPLVDSGNPSTDAGPPTDVVATATDGGPVDGGVDSGIDAGVDVGTDAGMVTPGMDAGFGCTIDGQFYPSRALNPADRTQCCNPVSAPGAWTALFVQGQISSLCSASGEGVAADLDGDGIADLAVCCYDDPPGVQVYLGLGGGAFSAPVLSSTAHGCYGLGSGVLRGDAGIDLVLPYNDKIIGVLLNQGNGMFGGELDFDTDGDPQRVAVGDLDGDGWPDIAYGESNGNVGVLFNLGRGDARFGSGVIVSSALQGIDQVHLGDFNGDGLLDIAANFSGVDENTVIFLLNDGGGTFGAAVSAEVPGTLAFAVAPLAQMGIDDLVSDSTSNGGVFIIGANLGGLNATSPMHTGLTAGPLMVGDINGDGAIDIVQAEWGNSFAVLFGKGDGSFWPAVTFTFGAGQSAQTFELADLNGDGAIDIAMIYGSTSWLEITNGCP